MSQKESRIPRLSRRDLGRLVLVPIAASLASACASDSVKPVEARKVPLYPDESFRTLSKEDALKRLAELRNARPDCVVDPNSSAVDQELQSLITKKRTYSPLPLPAEPRAAQLVDEYRVGIDNKLQQAAVRINRLPDSIQRALELAGTLREYSDVEAGIGSRSQGAVSVDLIDLAGCHRAKANSLVIYAILNSGTNPIPVPSKI